MIESEPRSSGVLPLAAASARLRLQIGQPLTGAAHDPFLSLAELVRYSGMSRYMLRRFLCAPAHAALPCYRPGGKIVVKRSEFDAWMGRHRKVGDIAVNELLSEMGFPFSQGGDTC